MMDTKSKNRDVLFVLLFAPFLCHPTCKLVKITSRHLEKPSFFRLQQLYSLLNIFVEHIDICLLIFISDLSTLKIVTRGLYIENSTTIYFFDLASLSKSCLYLTMVTM